MQNDEISIREILGIIKKNIIWVILTALVICGLFTVYAILSPDQYSTSMKIMIVKSDETRDLMMSGFSWYWNPTELNNEVEILSTGRIAHLVSDSLPEQFINQLLPDPEMSLTDKRRLSAGLINGMIAVEPIQDTDIIRVKVNGGSPELVYNIALVLRDVYLADHLSEKKRSISRVRKFLENQVQLFNDKLSASEKRVQEYKTRTGTIYLGNESVERIKRMADFEARYYDAKTTYAIKKKNLELVESRLDSQKLEAYDKLSSISSPLIDELKDRIVELKVQKSNLELQGYGYDHPKIQSLNRQIEDQQRMLTESINEFTSGSYGIDPVTIYQKDLEDLLSLQVETEVEKKKMEEYQKIINSYESSLENVPEDQMELMRLSRELEVNEKIYLMLKEKFEEAKIKEAGKLGDLRVIDGPYMPQRPFKPRRKLLIFIGLVGGLFLGLGVSLVKEYLDFKIILPDDFERLEGVKLLGYIPRASKKLQSRVLSEFERKLSKSELQNNFALIRKNIELIKTEGENRVILVTSTLSGAGKSTCAVNLGISFAQSGKKVLLIDCDLRKPVLHEFFSLENPAGLVDIIFSDKSPSQVIKHVDDYSLNILTSGESKEYPLELFESSLFSNLMEELRKEYDYILIDTGPILMVPDAAILSSISDCVVLVEESGRTHGDQLLRAKKILEDVRSCLFGVILNKVKVTRGKYYYNYGRY